jgi:P22 coat protein - gene protein 5
LANQILTRQEITYSSLEILENELTVLKHFYRDLDQEFGKKGGKIGDTIFVRKPERFVGRDGQAYSPEGLTDTQVPITINQQSGVDFEFSTAEKYLSIDNLRERTLEPAMISLSNKLDLRCALVAQQNTANLVGVPGTTPGLGGTDAYLIYRQANQKLEEMGFPIKRGRTTVITPAMTTGWIDYTKGFYNPEGAISKQWDEGQVANALRNKWFVDQNLPTQVIGALGGTPAVNGANQTGTSLITNGWTDSIAGLLNIGDVFSIAGVFAVNPQSRVSTGSLQQFVVQATAASDVSGNSTLAFLPAIVPSGQFQNVTNSPAQGALISIYNTAAAGQSALSGLATPQGLTWDKQAYAFVSFPGDVPEGVDMGMEERSPEVGVSLRFVRLFDGYRDQWINRFDVYYGIGTLYMEGGVRIAS